MSIARSKAHRVISAAAMVAILDLTSASARADRSWWTLSGNWNTAGNWRPASVPTSADNVTIFISADDPNTIFYDGAYSSDLSVQVDHESPQNVADATTTIIHNTGYDLGARYLYLGLFANGTASYQHYGGNVSLRTGLFLGDDPSSKGVYLLQGGSLRVRGGGAGAGGQKGVYVGYGGAGTLTQTAGDISTGGVDVPLVLANSAGSTGVYNMGGASTAEFDGDAFIGGSPTAAGGDGEMVINHANASMSIAGKLKIWNTSFSNVQLKSGSLSVGSIENVGIVPRFDWTGGALTIGTNNSSSTFGATSNGGAGKLIKEGSGTLDISGVLSYTGGTTINAGTLRVNSANALGSGGVVIKSGAILSLNNTSLNVPVTAVAGSTLTSNGTASFNGTLTAPTSGTIVIGHTSSGALTIGNAANDLTGGGVSSKINIEGAGAVVLAQPSNVVAHWYVNSTLHIGTDSALGNAANSLDFTAGTLHLTAALNSARALTINTGGGTLDTNSFNSTFSGAINGAGTLTKMSSGLLSVKNVRTGGLTISGGGLRMLPDSSAAGVSKVGALSIAAGLRLDLGSNKLIVVNTAVGALGASNVYAGLSGLIQSGRNGGGWAGNGIVTTQTQATSGNFTSIGIASASQVRGIAPNATSTWGGQTVAGSDALVMYTYGGDANLDGKINVDDYTRIDFNAALGTAGWYNGDFNYDGKINVDDYTIIDFNVGIQGAPFATGGGAEALSAVAIPEPVGLSALIVGLALAGGRRRRKCRRPGRAG